MNRYDENFLADVMLGKLVRYMRMMGFDVEYALDLDLEADPEIAEYAEENGRTVLTRDVELSESTDSILLRTRGIEDQLHELHETGYVLELSEPGRCSVCNGVVEEPVEDLETPDHAPEDQRIWRCQDCGNLYWKGSHWDDVADTLSKIKD
ncbi:MAG: Mut7-C RNAse domain-containing protein [Halobacteria archaeon]